jgi:Ca-activated chloride channel family protein
MKRRVAIQHFMGAAAASCLARLLHGGPTPRNDEEPNYTIRSEARLVVLDVSVTDSHGAIVSGLPKQSFTVLENGRPQPITVFNSREIPVAIGLVVDESRSMTPKRGDVLTAAEVFIEESNPLDQMFVLNFNDTVRRGLPGSQLFSDNVRELRAALDRGRAEGKTALNDAVIAGIQQLELGRREEKCLVVISDGGDNASGHSRHEMLAAVENSIATIYSIGLFDEDDTDRNPGVLRRMAQISGGEAYFPENPSGMIPICRKIAKDLRSRYTIAYVPQPANGKALRHLEVRVLAPDHTRLRARSRTYYRY